MKKFYLGLIILFIIVAGIVAYLNMQKNNSNRSGNNATSTPITNTTSLPKVDTSNWKAYKNDQYGFEFKYPDNWKVEDIGNGLTISPSTIQCADCSVNLTIWNLEKLNQKTPTSLNDFLGFDEKSKSPNTLIKAEQIKVDNMDAYHIITKYNTSLERIVFYKNGYQYTLTNNYPSSGTVAHEAVEVTYGIAESFSFFK